MTYKAVTFAALLTTLSSGQADIVISDIYATKERAKAADFITYSKVFDGVLVAKGNPKKITGINTSLCGAAAAENTGYVEVPLIQDLMPKCKEEGKAEPTIQLYDNNANCIQAILAGRADTYINDVNTVDQAVKANPDKLEKAIAVTIPYSVGIGVPKNKPEFRDAVLAALIEVQKAGIHMDLLKKWNLDVEQLQGTRHSVGRLMSLFLHYLSLPYLISGVWFTLAVTALGLAGGLFLGLVLAAMQLSRFWMLAAFARGYTIIFRGTPLILQMVFAYDALPQIGLKLSAIGAAGLALAANEAPFIAEMLRAGVLGVDRGQVLAGQALGMTPSLLMRRIIAPQAIRTMIPAFGNETVSALKNSSLASVISVQELTLRSTQLASSTFDFFSIFFASGLIYLLLTTGVSVIQLFVEARARSRPARDREPLCAFAAVVPCAIGAGACCGQIAAATAPAQSRRDRGAQDANKDAKVSRADRTRRSATLARNEVVVDVDGLYKAYTNQPVLAGVDLTVRLGEVIALLGPSGSGKSTLLRCINHLEGWDAGTVKVGGRRMGFREDGKPLSPRDLADERATVGVGMVFQQFNLFSHLTALENIAGPLRWVHGVSRVDADRRARELLERVGLSARANALPRHLSGGQQQRVAIARAIAPNPARAAARRADLGARSGTGQRSAGSDPAARGRGRPDHDHLDPSVALCRRGRRPRRVSQRRLHHRGRACARGSHPAPQPHYRALPERHGGRQADRRACVSSASRTQNEPASTRVIRGYQHETPSPSRFARQRPMGLFQQEGRAGVDAEIGRSRHHRNADPPRQRRLRADDRQRSRRRERVPLDQGT